LIDKYGEALTIETESEIKTSDGHSRSVWVDATSVTGWIQDASSQLILEFAKRNIKITHRVYLYTNPDCEIGDRIKTASGSSFVIRGFENSAGLDALFVLLIESEI
jgi:hypothetical protein